MERTKHTEDFIIKCNITMQDIDLKSHFYVYPHLYTNLAKGKFGRAVVWGEKNGHANDVEILV